MDPSGSSASGSNGPQKRVLPSRTRRGGPGVGSCETDLLILEHQKRRFETEALIPPDTPFLLSTNSKQFYASNDSIEVAIVPSERYFDRPDVVEAFRNKQIFPTPEWNEVGVPDVGRFRPRGPEDANIDTSDAAYERRHKKYENFEKRQRLREKEKLKHEQYKLKERIDQLRIMDASAFLTLPASNFSPAPVVPEDEVDSGLASFSGAYINGSSTYNEGERRRKEMLDIALSLEARFRVLLPPEKIRKPQTQRTTRENTAASPATIHAQLRRAVSDTEVSEREEEIVDGDNSDQRHDNLKIKLKLGEKDSISQFPASHSVYRNSKRLVPMNVPSTQKYQRRKSHPAVNPYPSLDPSSSPQVQAEGPFGEEEGVEPQLEVLVPSDSQTPTAIPHEQGHYSELVQNHAAHADGTNSGLPPIPPQKQEQESLPYIRSESVLETGATSPEQEAPPDNVSVFPQTWEEDPRASSIYVDIESLQEPAPERRYLSPPPIETLQHVPSSQPTKVNPPFRRRPGRPRKVIEDHSKLLDLANAAASSSSQPPSKRTKMRHQPVLTKIREPSNRPSEATERETVPGSLSASTFSQVTIGKAVFTNGAPGDAFSIARHSHSAGIVSPIPSISVSVPPSEAFPSISEAAANFRRARGISSGRRSNVEYQSRDTGALRRTDSLLLIASIRGGIRQTQRHQMAFGVKVPEEISTPYDFWLPDEYLPEEEVLKYSNYAS